MADYRAIGDLHGRYNYYIQLCQSSPYPTIQVGDYGIGFKENPITHEDDLKRHRFLLGNHDDPFVAARQKNFIPTGHIEDRMMIIGGAKSIDKDSRKEGINWWPEEECSDKEFKLLKEMYLDVKPVTMLTHDIPEDIFHTMFIDKGRRAWPDHSRTRTALQSMFEEYQPKLWIAGHYHMSWHRVVAGTRFIVLDIEDHIDFTSETGEIIL